ncbi:Alpha-aspartyl dipeptidase [Araneus ventricosus]|uniref:dipeptidase E n=1 Tax=Araneus ventricosus TaxID=182803 RepID=A0A4Y2DWM0_ARAVE|nr:Alpha-aspartyl dipeptidase [Araneus ventricosus]
MASPRLLLVSNSKLHGEDFFEWCSETFKSFFKKSNVKKLLFFPYASRDYDGYVEKIEPALKKQGLEVESIHRKPDPVAAVRESQGIFIGGGNTFLLLKTLYEQKLVEPIRDCVLNKGIPFMGSSAGTNVATRSINTTNDMPICMPPSFEALKLVPFNINPHYIDTDPNSTHMGETREDRLLEFLREPDCAPVLALREGSGLVVEDGKITLFGRKNARFFKKGQDPIEYEPDTDLSFLLNVEC